MNLNKIFVVSFWMTAVPAFFLSGEMLIAALGGFIGAMGVIVVVTLFALPTGDLSDKNATAIFTILLIVAGLTVVTGSSDLESGLRSAAKTTLFVAVIAALIAALAYVITRAVKRSQDQQFDAELESEVPKPVASGIKGIVKNGAVICPNCKVRSLESLEFDNSVFRCPSCDTALIVPASFTRNS